MGALKYSAIVSRGTAGRVLVRFPDLPGVATDSEDLEEAVAEAEDCLGSNLAIRMVQKERMPVPSAPKRGPRLVTSG